MFTRTQLILGKEGLSRLQSLKVVIFGIGGVGSWCAESLIRTGVMNLTLVDSDVVCHSNINRQLHATHETIGKVKVDVMKSRLLTLNPEAHIEVVHTFYDETTADDFHLEQFDVIIDAIDSTESKILLMERASALADRGVLFLSAMGAALKINASRIKTADFWDVHGCPLASRLRKQIRRTGRIVGHFKCVYSDEVLENRREGLDLSVEQRVNGSLVHITAIYGMILTSEVVKSVMGE
jgi:tRNA A37 threonylcarbamoyladenosine dehydratase